MDKPTLRGLVRDDPKTPEGKYLVKRRDGTVVEWPSFTLGARDPHAIAALIAYADSSAKDEKCHPDYVKRLYELVNVFNDYREKYGAGDPHKGIHRTDDPVTVAEMKKGWSS